MNNRKVRVALVGVGNCASALIQGVEFYRDANEDDFVPGLMHVNLGGYHVRDIEFVAAFDVSTEKVGKDVSEAMFAAPNNTIKFCDVPNLGVTVQRGNTADGRGKYVGEIVEQSSEQAADVAAVLRETRAEVLISYLPVGSAVATRWEAEQAREAGGALTHRRP